MTSFADVLGSPPSDSEGLSVDQVRGLLSLLLSSGSMHRVRGPGPGIVQLSLNAGKEDAAYLHEKVEELGQFIPLQGTIRTVQGWHGVQRSSWLRHRTSTPRLHTIYNLLYPRGTRQITSIALSLCGLRALAWYWSDWATPCAKHLAIARVGTTEDEARLVAEWMEGLVGVTPEIGYKRQGATRPQLRIPHQQAARAADILLGHAPLSRQPFFRALRDGHYLHDSGAALLPWGGHSAAARRQSAPLARDQAA